MKKVKLLMILIVPVMMSCNQNKSGNQASKDVDDKAMLVENAKVSDENDEPQSVEDFIKEAASGGLMEVELGRYAQQNALNPRVKNFGAMMVRDHQKANDELKSIVTGKNMTIPSAMENNHMNKVEEIQKETGADFDRKYMDEMVDDHDKDVKKFRRQAENGKDPEIKAFAAKTLEVLVIHQDSAKNIKEALDRQNSNTGAATKSNNR
ncbi:MAG TPA: DUF4142 domain-containing protein [Bacteroidales bacterium]|nr:DUF4142 domain-containing protein [Bacteroidales bacterium]